MLQMTFEMIYTESLKDLMLKFICSLNAQKADFHCNSFVWCLPCLPGGPLLNR